MNLTKGKIDKLIYKRGTDIRWDTSLPGFGLRIFLVARTPLFWITELTTGTAVIL